MPLVQRLLLLVYLNSSVFIWSTEKGTPDPPLSPALYLYCLFCFSVVVFSLFCQTLKHKLTGGKRLQKTGEAFSPLFPGNPCNICNLNPICVPICPFHEDVIRDGPLFYVAQIGQTQVELWRLWFLMPFKSFLSWYMDIRVI